MGKKNTTSVHSKHPSPDKNDKDTSSSPFPVEVKTPAESIVRHPVNNPVNNHPSGGEEDTPDFRRKKAQAELNTSRAKKNKKKSAVSSAFSGEDEEPYTDNTVEPKWLYRLESVDEDKGLWYTPDGFFVRTLESVPGNETWRLPMDYDPRYKADGRDWFSSCTRIEDLTHWYSVEDVRYLLARGFRMTKWLATEYTEYEKETVFIKDSCLSMEVLTVEEVFGKQ